MPKFKRTCAVFCACIATSVHADLTSGLLSYWTFENHLDDYAHGLAGSSSAVQDDGSWVGSASFATGYNGSGIEISGSEYVSVADSVDVDRSNQSLTLSAWFRVDNWNTGWQALISKGEQDCYRVARNNNSSSELAGFAGASSGGDVTGGSVNDGGWHHVLMTVQDGGATALWIDGSFIGQNTNAATISNSAYGTVQPLLIGNNPDRLGRAWIGAIDEVGIWARVLGSSEIAELASGTRPGESTVVPVTGIEDGLLSYWAFENNLSDSAHGQGASSQVADLGSWVGSSVL